MKINKALKTLITFNGLYLFGSLLFGPLYAVYVQKIGGGVTLISVSVAAFYISTTLFLVFVGKFGDRVKEKENLLAASYLIRTFGFLAYLVINNALFLILVQLIHGLAEALGTPTFSALFAKHLDGDSEVLEYSDWALVASLIMAIGSLIGGYFVNLFGFSALFIVVAAICFVSFLGIYLQPRRLL